MVHLVGVSSVFVPFEKRRDQWVKRDDLPRFLRSKQAVDYIRDHPEISYRTFQGQNWPVILEWREHSEPDLIKEYARGVGSPEFNRQRRKRSGQFRPKERMV